MACLQDRLKKIYGKENNGNNGKGHGNGKGKH